MVISRGRGRPQKRPDDPTLRVVARRLVNRKAAKKYRVNYKKNSIEIENELKQLEQKNIELVGKVESISQQIREVRKWLEEGPKTVIFRKL